jgi:hypothetical protein
MVSFHYIAGVHLRKRCKEGPLLMYTVEVDSVTRVFELRDARPNKNTVK